MGQSSLRLVSLGIADEADLQPHLPTIATAGHLLQLCGGVGCTVAVDKCSECTSPSALFVGVPPSRSFAAPLSKLMLSYPTIHNHVWSANHHHLETASSSNHSR